jgi:hypothetical protein
MVRNITVHKLKRKLSKNTVHQLWYFSDSDIIQIDKAPEKGLVWLLTQEFIHEALDKTVSPEASDRFDKLMREVTEPLMHYCNYFRYCKRGYTCEFCPCMIGIVNKMEKSLRRELAQ